MTYSTMLLDIDHTLVDSDRAELEAYKRTLSNQGVADPMAHFELYKKINRGLWAAAERGEILPTDVRERRFEVLVDELGIVANTAEMADDFVAGFTDFSELYPGVRAVLDHLSTRATLALITNGLSEVQRPRVERLDLERYVDAIVVSGEVGVTKPGTAIFDILFEALGNPQKSDVVIIGDSLTSDIKGGSNYGIATCWYNPNGQVAGPEHNITHEITSLSEVLSLAPALQGEPPS